MSTTMADEMLLGANVDAGVSPIELAIVGPIILGEDLALAQIDGLKKMGFGEKNFLSRACRKVWMAACSMIDGASFTRDKLVDVLLDSEELGQTKVERSAWISKTSLHGIAIQMLENAAVLIERDLRQEALESIDSAKTADGTEEIIASLERSIANVRLKMQDRSRDEKADACSELKLELDSMLSGKGTLPQTGVPMWDTVMGGMPPAQLVILAGRPGGGKTSLAEQVIDESLYRGIPTLYIQRELSRTRAIGRLACRRSKVSWSRFELKRINQSEMMELKRNVEAYEKLPLFLEPVQVCTGPTVAATIRDHCRNHDVRLVVLDHIQLIDCPKGMELRHAIGELTRNLKLVANETGATIIAISQLSRFSERHGDAPKKSDLNESGRIEQDADIILALWTNSRGDAPRWTVNWSILKNRNGAEGTVPVMFDGPSMSFLGRAIEGLK